MDATSLERFDFDRAVVQWWRWYEAKQNEQAQVPENSMPKLRPGHVWGPKYSTDQDIIALYYGDRRTASVIDPVVAAITPEDLDQLMDEWDPNDLPV